MQQKTWIEEDSFLDSCRRQLLITGYFSKSKKVLVKFDSKEFL